MILRFSKVRLHNFFCYSDAELNLEDMGYAIVSGRNNMDFPGSVATLRKQLHLREGGSAHFIATTLADGSRHLIRVEREAHPLPLL